MPALIPHFTLQVELASIAAWIVCVLVRLTRRTGPLIDGITLVSIIGASLVTLFVINRFVHCRSGTELLVGVFVGLIASSIGQSKN